MARFLGDNPSGLRVRTLLLLFVVTTSSASGEVPLADAAMRNDNTLLHSCKSCICFALGMDVHLTAYPDHIQERHQRDLHFTEPLSGWLLLPAAFI